jgi:UDP-N-acetylmuramoyl-L-alanyl-D-glutamate--2,6-diaminopimelate ligase
MKLREIIEGLKILETQGDLDVDIKSIAYDSRKACKDSLFVCIDGTKTDGHKFIQNAIDNGAKAFLLQKPVELPEGCIGVRIADTRFGMAYTSDKFFNHPSGKFRLTGITGTKGKTTITYMIKSILEKKQLKVGLIGTIANMICDEKLYSTHTTPESVDLQGLFDEMSQRNVEDVVIEVSSHALDLHRVSCSDFDIGVFTNLTRDHLDYHLTFENYLAAKAKLFSMCKIGLVNIDNEYGEKILELAQCKTNTFGILNKNADVFARDIVKKQNSVDFYIVTPWGEGPLSVNIPGNFTVYNALAAAAVCLINGIDMEFIQAGLKQVSVPGRAEVVETGRDFSILIDYAHTPDSLENILNTVKGYVKGRIISVFGCGGDRDRTKRPIMGEISSRLADFTIITSDNPRTEEPESIIKEIESGISNQECCYITITDRKQAIRYSIENAKKDDVIVLAGKGHETYQQFATKTIHFDEREVVKEILEEMK